jgi:hypothetical protein
MSINRDIVITLSILIIIILIFNLTNFDTIIQNHFFNFKNQEWILDRDKEPYKFIFYDGIKKLLFLIASGCKLKNTKIQINTFLRKIS